MRRTRFVPLLLCTVAPCLAIIVVMTAAAGDHPDDPAEAADELGPRSLHTAAEVTRAAASARVELRTIVAGPAGPVALVHRGAFTDGGVRARAESDMSEVAAALEAAGQELDGDWSRPTGIVVDGDSVFSQLGPMAEALGRAPDDWARARLSEVTGPASLADNDTLALALDPLGPLDLLRHPVIEVGLVGDDEVRGTPTRHVRARLDLTPAAATVSGGEEPAGEGPEAGVDEAGSNGVNGNGNGNGNGSGDGDGSGSGSGRNGVSQATAAADEPAGSFEAHLVAAGITSLPIDVWLDGEGAVRRLTVTIDGSASVTTTFEVYDIGADVDVAPPDPSDVIDPGETFGE
jgi:hypothetical protein